MNKKLFAACAVLAAVAMAAGFAVNINGNVINAFTGFQVAAAAPSGHVLCGNGTNYIDCSAAPTATALATTPVQCGGGTPLATGIAANGDANCTSAGGGIAGSVTDVTASRTAGTAYHNAGSSMIYVSGRYTTSGSAVAEIDCVIGSTSVPNISVDANQYGATTNGDSAGFRCMVPAGWYYQINVGGSATLTLAGWYETKLQ